VVSAARRQGGGSHAHVVPAGAGQRSPVGTEGPLVYFATPSPRGRLAVVCTPSGPVAFFSGVRHHVTRRNADSDPQSRWGDDLYSGPGAPSPLPTAASRLPHPCSVS
jgi:hypothetical protein